MGRPHAAAVMPVVASAPAAPRESVLGNCARCGSDRKLKFCSRCQLVRYCGLECQKADVRGGRVGRDGNGDRCIFSFS